MPTSNDTNDEIYQIDLRIESEPPSVQSRKNKKVEFINRLREAVRRYDFLLIDDVRLTIEWWLQEEEKYGCDRKADIDNILKPMIDALTGPDGLLVDDTMIQSLYCGWLGHNHESDMVLIRIESVTSESISEIAIMRTSLVFVEVDRNMYLPIDESLPAEVRRTILTSVSDRILARDKVRALTGCYHLAQSVMPIQRLFHRSRIVKFPTFALSGYLAKLDAM